MSKLLNKKAYGYELQPKDRPDGEQNILDEPGPGLALDTGMNPVNLLADEGVTEPDAMNFVFTSKLLKKEK